jgi:MFS family permease
MAITILVYAGFTALCGIADSWQELALYRFLTGLGIGGEWAAGAALIAESWPEKSRAKAAGIMQASGGVGFFLASLLYFFIGPYGWRWVFALGVLPAVVAFYIRYSLEEPQRWVSTKQTGNPYSALFKHPLRRDVLIGTGLAVIATFGYQGAIQWVPSWVSAMLHAQGAKSVIPQVSLITTVLNFGGMIGCLCFPFVADRWDENGRYSATSLARCASLPTTPARREFHPGLAGLAHDGILCRRRVHRLCHLLRSFSHGVRATAQGFITTSLASSPLPHAFAAGALVSAHGSASRRPSRSSAASA